MPTIKYFDVYINGTHSETYTDDGVITPSSLIEKHKDDGKVSVKRRQKKVVSEIIGGCKDGVCPVKVKF